MGERAPGTHCLGMCLIATEFHGDCVRTCTCTYGYWSRHKLTAPPPRLGTRLSCQSAGSSLVPEHKRAHEDECNEIFLIGWWRLTVYYLIMNIVSACVRECCCPLA